MNKQLKELYYKAHDTSDVPGAFPQYFSATKFAELIIRECASIAATAEPWKSDDLILRHFGIDKDTN